MDIKKDFDTAKQLFNKRIRLKQISQISYELREIDKSFPADYYDVVSAEHMLALYSTVENKILSLAKEIADEQLIINNQK